MKRLMLGSLSIVLVAAATTTTLRAQTVEATALNPATSNSVPTRELTPFNLVHLAHRGYFKQQGVPSYLTLTTAYRAGQIDAFDLVQAAVEANRLDTTYLTNQGYLRTVEAQLRTLESLN